MKNKLRLNVVLNVILAIVLISVAYSWMVTEPSYGEVIEYNRNLIVASSGIDVEVYIYEENDYVLYKGEDIIVNNMAPNDSIRFKFVMTNTKSVATLTDIVFANIYGDVEVLEPYLSITSASPESFSKLLKDNLLTTSTYDGLEITNYMKFYEDFKVESNSSQTIYWTIDLDKTADNSVANKNLTIENIIFLNA